MNRLEQAARVSMGGFQDSEASAAPSPRAFHLSRRVAFYVPIAVIVLAAASLLF